MESDDRRLAEVEAGLAGLSQALHFLEDALSGVHDPEIQEDAKAMPLPTYLTELAGAVKGMREAVPRHSQTVSALRSLMHTARKPASELASGYLSFLPQEILAQVLSLLSCRDLVYVAQCNKHINLVAQENSIWRHLFLRSYCISSLSSSSPYACWTPKQRQSSALRDHDKRTSPVGAPDSSIPKPRAKWKDVYVERWNIEKNWRKEEYTQGFTTRLGDGIINALCLFREDPQRLPLLIAASSSNSDISILDSDNGTLVRTIPGHKYPITSFAAVQDTAFRLASGSDDATWRLWDIENSKCLSIFTSHKECVTRIASCGPHSVLTASLDHEIQMWDVRQRKRVKIFRHSHGVVSLCAGDSLFAAAGFNGPIRLWDLRSDGNDPIASYTGHNMSVWAIQLNEHLGIGISGDIGGGLHIWSTDASNRNEKQEIINRAEDKHGFYFAPLCLDLTEDRLVMGDVTGAVLVWHHPELLQSAGVADSNLNSRFRIAPSSSANKAVRAMVVDTDRLVVGLEDGTVTSHNFT